MCSVNVQTHILIVKNSQYVYVAIQLFNKFRKVIPI